MSEEPKTRGLVADNNEYVRTEEGVFTEDDKQLDPIYRHDDVTKKVDVWRILENEDLEGFDEFKDEVEDLTRCYSRVEVEEDRTYFNEGTDPHIVSHAQVCRTIYVAEDKHETTDEDNGVRVAINWAVGEHDLHLNELYMKNNGYSIKAQIRERPHEVHIAYAEGYDKYA